MSNRAPLTPEECLAAAGQWQSLAYSRRRQADAIASSGPDIFGRNADILRGQADHWEQVAVALRMQAETGIPHCSCTNPPHPLK